MNRAEQREPFPPDPLASLALAVPLLGGIIVQCLMTSFGIFWILGEGGSRVPAGQRTVETIVGYALLAAPIVLTFLFIWTARAMNRGRSRGFWGTLALCFVLLAAALLFRWAWTGLFVVVAAFYVILRLTLYGPKPT